MLSTKIRQNKDLENTTFARIFNPNHVKNLIKFIRRLENLRSNELKKC